MIIERDAKADLDSPARDPDLVDDKTEQFLAMVEVESVEGVGGPLGESADPLAESVGSC